VINPSGLEVWGKYSCSSKKLDNWRFHNFINYAAVLFLKVQFVLFVGVIIKNSEILIILTKNDLLGKVFTFKS